MKETLETSRMATINDLYELDKADDAAILLLKKRISVLRKAKIERRKQREIYFKEVFQQPPGTLPQPIQSDNFGYSLISSQDNK